MVTFAHQCREPLVSGNTSLIWPRYSVTSLVNSCQQITSSPRKVTFTDLTVSLRSTQVDPLGSSEDSQYFNQDYLTDMPVPVSNLKLCVFQDVWRSTSLYSASLCFAFKTLLQFYVMIWDSTVFKISDSVLGKGVPMQYAYFKCIFMEFDNLPKVLLGLFMKQWIWRDTWNNFITVSSFLFSVWCSLSVLPYIIKWVYVTGMGSVLLTCINAYVLKPLVFLWYVFLQ